MYLLYQLANYINKLFFYLIKKKNDQLLIEITELIGCSTVYGSFGLVFASDKCDFLYQIEDQAFLILAVSLFCTGVPLHHF